MAVNSVRRSLRAESGTGRCAGLPVTALVFLALCSACGTPVPPTPPDPKAVPAVEAQSATLEEKNDQGVLLWRVSAARARQRGGDVACESVAFLVPGGGVSAVGGGRHALPAFGFTASAPVGTVSRPDSGAHTLVVLDSGFVVRMENGWTVSGRTLRWNGELIRAAGNVVIERPGMRMQGHDGVIHPRGPRVEMRGAHGTIEGVAI